MDNFHVCHICHLILTSDLFHKFKKDDDLKICLGCRDKEEAELRWSNYLKSRGLNVEAEQIKDNFKSLKRKKNSIKPQIDADNFLNLRVWQKLINDPQIKISNLCLGLSEEQVTQILPQIGFFNFYLQQEIRDLKEEKEELELKFEELNQRLTILENEKLEIEPTLNKMSLYS